MKIIDKIKRSLFGSPNVVSIRTLTLKDIEKLPPRHKHFIKLLNDLETPEYICTVYVKKDGEEEVEHKINTSHPSAVGDGSVRLKLDPVDNVVTLQFPREGIESIRVDTKEKEFNWDFNNGWMTREMEEKKAEASVKPGIVCPACGTEVVVGTDRICPACGLDIGVAMAEAKETSWDFNNFHVQREMKKKEAEYSIEPGIVCYRNRDHLYITYKSGVEEHFVRDADMGTHNSFDGAVTMNRNSLNVKTGSCYGESIPRALLSGYRIVTERCFDEK